ncbi:glycosyltransferase family 4 protein [Phycisphaerales bacterium AB-hyl4]|uniref:Glycosyltransferase family 4 protein n=1 Tax=Natronomicrosphaera hydrolytica TaxID=3242702 RepID=A0ABV4U3M2_9BACT
MTGRRLQILIVGPNSDGTDVGEAWSTYRWVQGLAAEHDVTLLTYRKRDRASAVEQLPGVKVVEWTDLPLVGRFERFNSMAKPGYIPFYIRARRWLRAAQREGRTFDVVHQVAPLALRYPCPAVGFGWPIVIGPVAGSLDTPKPFAAEVGGDRWYTRLRDIDGWRLRNDPWLRRSYEQAAAVIGVAPYVRDTVLAGLNIRRFEVCSETGVTSLPDVQPDARTGDRDASAPLRLLHVGRLVRTKGLRDAVRALGEVGAAWPWQLDVLGEGPDRVACEAEASQLGIADRVRFHGRLPREQVEDYYRAADVFVFPSFREPSGNVVLEAMSHGLPTIVADRGGPAAAVTATCGVRVAVTSPSEYVHALAEALHTLARDRAAREAMGQAARQRIASDYLWPRKIAWLSQLHQSLAVETRREPVATGEAVGSY